MHDLVVHRTVDADALQRVQDHMLVLVGIPDGDCIAIGGNSECEDFRFTPTSFIGGGQIGIQQQYGSVVFGVEGTWSGTDLHQTDESALHAGSFRSIKINEIATGPGNHSDGRWQMSMSQAVDKIPNGPGAAAILGAGIGCAMLGILAFAAEASRPVADMLNFYNPVGPLSGKTTIAIIVWLAA